MAFGDAPVYTQGSRFDPRDSWADLLLRTRGRISRRTFAVFFVPVALAWVGLGTLVASVGPQEVEQLDALWWLATGPFAWMGATLAAKRLQDLGVSPWLAVFLAMPYVRWVFAVALAATPGESTYNRHGWPPPDAKKALFRVG